MSISNISKIFVIFLTFMLIEKVENLKSYCVRKNYFGKFNNIPIDQVGGLFRFLKLLGNLGGMFSVEGH